MDKVKAKLEGLEAMANQNETLKMASEKTGLAPFHVGVCGALTTVAALFAMGGMRFISSLICFLPPAYSSFKAVESEATDDDTQWLTYWVMFSFFTVCESISDAVISWIPFYFWIKTAILQWAYQVQGAEWTYTNVIRPAFMKLESEVGEVAESLGVDGAAGSGSGSGSASGDKSD